MVKTQKQNNSANALTAKAEIRRNVLDAIDESLSAIDGPVKVFDAFCGTGKMHKAVWHLAEHYTGCDKEWARDERRCFVADNRRVMRGIDLSAFNVFDLDAHGSPWEQAFILAARREVAPGETIGVVLTDGTGLAMIGNHVEVALARLAGLKPDGMVGVLRQRDAILDRAVIGLAKALHCQIVARWQADGKNEGQAQVRYIGLVLKGIL
jgi:hypothetical protein